MSYEVMLNIEVYKIIMTILPPSPFNSLPALLTVFPRGEYC